MFGCPPGVYGPSAGLSYPSCDGLCPAGFFCPGNVLFEGCILWFLAVRSSLCIVLPQETRHHQRSVGTRQCTVPRDHWRHHWCLLATKVSAPWAMTPSQSHKRRVALVTTVLMAVKSLARMVVSAASLAHPQSVIVPSALPVSFVVGFCEQRVSSVSPDDHSFLVVVSVALHKSIAVWSQQCVLSHGNRAASGSW